MHIMIEIPDEKVPATQELMYIGLHFIDEHVCECTYPYIILPKGHGRLIDADALRISLVENEWISNVDGGGLEDLLDDAPTIIEAGTAESED